MAMLPTVLLIVTVLFVAPLVLGTYVVAQGLSRDRALAWFGFITAATVFGLLVGAIALGLLLAGF